MAEVRLEVALAHPRERVWQALTDARLLGEWFIPTDLRPVEGNLFTLEPGTLAGFVGPVSGELTELVAPERMVMLWRGEKLHTRVTWELAAEGRGCTLQLVQTGFIGAPATLRRRALRDTYTRQFTERLPAVLDRLAAREVTSRTPIRRAAVATGTAAVSGAALAASAGAAASVPMPEAEPPPVPRQRRVPGNAPVAGWAAGRTLTGPPGGDPAAAGPDAPAGIPPVASGSPPVDPAWPVGTGSPVGTDSSVGTAWPAGTAWPGGTDSPLDAGSSAAGASPPAVAQAGAPVAIGTAPIPVVPAPRRSPESPASDAGRAAGLASAAGPASLAASASLAGPGTAAGSRSQPPGGAAGNESTVAASAAPSDSPDPADPLAGPPSKPADPEWPYVVQTGPPGRLASAPAWARTAAIGAAAVGIVAAVLLAIVYVPDYGDGPAVGVERDQDGPGAAELPAEATPLPGSAAPGSPDRPGDTPADPGGGTPAPGEADDPESGSADRSEDGEDPGGGPPPGPAAPPPVLTASLSSSDILVLGLGGKRVAVTVSNPGPGTATGWEVTVEVGDQEVTNVSGADYTRDGSVAVFRAVNTDLLAGSNAHFTFDLSDLLGAEAPTTCTIDGRACG